MFSPIIVARLSWRYIYWITSGLGIFAWFLLIVFVPETRFIRSDAELGISPPFPPSRPRAPPSLQYRTYIGTRKEKEKADKTTSSPKPTAGKEVYPLCPGETRPRVDVQTYGPRTYKTDFGVFHVTPEWARARRAVWDTLKTTFFPNVLWVILVNSIFVSVQGAAGQVGSSVLIAAGWEFEDLGLAVVPLVLASPFVWLVGGWGADKVSNWHARRPGRAGRREPEAHLLSLVVPLLCGVAGPVVFGYAGENVATVSTYVLLTGIFLVGFAYLTANALFSVYLVESYPAYAGYVTQFPFLSCLSSLPLRLSIFKLLPSSQVDQTNPRFTFQTRPRQRLLVPPHHRLRHVLRHHHLGAEHGLPQELRHLQRRARGHDAGAPAGVLLREADPGVHGGEVGSACGGGGGDGGNGGDAEGE